MAKVFWDVEDRFESFDGGCALDAPAALSEGAAAIFCELNSGSAVEVDEDGVLCIWAGTSANRADDAVHGGDFCWRVGSVLPLGQGLARLEVDGRLEVGASADRDEWESLKSWQQAAPVGEVAVGHQLSDSEMEMCGETHSTVEPWR